MHVQRLPRCSPPLFHQVPTLQAVLVQQQFLDIFIAIVAAGIMHAVYLAFNSAATL